MRIYRRCPRFVDGLSEEQILKRFPIDFLEVKYIGHKLGSLDFIPFSVRICIALLDRTFPAVSSTTAPSGNQSSHLLTSGSRKRRPRGNFLIRRPPGWQFVPFGKTLEEKTEKHISEMSPPSLCSRLYAFILCLIYNSIKGTDKTDCDYLPTSMHEITNVFFGLLVILVYVFILKFSDRYMYSECHTHRTSQSLLLLHTLYYLKQ